jgi:hypothetical protein
MNQLKLLLCLGFILVVSRAAGADVIAFSTGGDPPGYSYSEQYRYSSSIYEAFQFTTLGTQANYPLSMIRMQLGMESNMNLFGTVSIFDNSPAFGGTLLGSAQANLGSAAGPWVQPVEFVFNNDPTLLPNTTYWLSVQTNLPGDSILFMNNNGVETQRHYSFNSGADWTTDTNHDTLPAFEVRATPEPSTISLLGVGAFSFLVYACRRRSQAA